MKWHQLVCLGIPVDDGVCVTTEPGDLVTASLVTSPSDGVNLQYDFSIVIVGDD